MSYAGYTPPVAEMPYEEVLWAEMKYFVYYFAGFLGYMVIGRVCDFQWAPETRMSLFLWFRLFFGSVGLAYTVVQRCILPGFSMKFFAKYYFNNDTLDRFNDLELTAGVCVISIFLLLSAFVSASPGLDDDMDRPAATWGGDKGATVIPDEIHYLEAVMKRKSAGERWGLL